MLFFLSVEAMIFSSSPFLVIEHTFFGGDILFRFIEHYHFLCDLFISIPDMFLGQLISSCCISILLGDGLKFAAFFTFSLCFSYFLIRPSASLIQVLFGIDEFLDTVDSLLQFLSGGM